MMQKQKQNLTDNILSKSLMRKNTSSYYKQKKPVYQETEEYFVSQLSSNLLPRLYKSGDEITDRNPFITCEINKKRLYDVKTKHTRTLEMAKKTRTDLNSQWEQLEQKENELRDNFIHFETFFKENEEKRSRAKIKLVDLKSVIEKRDEDIFQLKEQILLCKSSKEKMEHGIKELKLFEVITL